MKTFCLNFLPVPFFIVTFHFVGTLYKWLICHKPKWQTFSHSVNCLFILLILFKKLCFLLTCFIFLWLTCFCVMFYICIHSHEDILQFSFFSLIIFSETTLSVFLALRALVSGLFLDLRSYFSDLCIHGHIASFSVCVISPCFSFLITTVMMVLSVHLNSLGLV